MLSLLDLSNPKPNWNKTAGFTKAETEAFASILNGPTDEELQGAVSRKFVDVWRRCVWASDDDS